MFTTTENIPTRTTDDIWCCSLQIPVTCANTLARLALLFTGPSSSCWHLSCLESARQAREGLLGIPPSLGEDRSCQDLLIAIVTKLGDDALDWLKLANKSRESRLKLERFAFAYSFHFNNCSYGCRPNKPTG